MRRTPAIPTRTRRGIAIRNPSGKPTRCMRHTTAIPTLIRRPTATRNRSGRLTRRTRRTTVTRTPTRRSTVTPTRTRRSTAARNPSGRRTRHTSGNPYSNPEDYSNPYSNPEFEWEDEGEYFFKSAFKFIKRAAKFVAPLAKRLAPFAAKALVSMIPGVGALAAPLVGQLTSQLLKEGAMEAAEMEAEFFGTNETEAEIGNTEHAHEAALTELLAAEAASAESESRGRGDAGRRPAHHDHDYGRPPAAAAGDAHARAGQRAAGGHPAAPGS